MHHRLVGLVVNQAAVARNLVVLQETDALNSAQTMTTESNPIPEEIIAKLSTRKILRTEQLRTPLQLKQDSIIADRSGFLRDSGRDAGFVLDALGRNVQQLSFRLLPCQVLELAQLKDARSPEPIRFKISAIVTKYKDQNYLLLQRATRTYGHQNFPK